MVTLNQNMFFRKDSTQRRNCHYLVLFNNPVDRQLVTILGRQMYPSRRNFLLQKFDEASERPYGNLLVDLKPTTPNSLRLAPTYWEQASRRRMKSRRRIWRRKKKRNTNRQIRGCPVDEPTAKRCKREDGGIESTYDYELECYLKDLPVTVCCANQLPARVESWAQSFVVNTDSCDKKGHTGWHFISQKKDPPNFSIRSDEHRKRIAVASETCWSLTDCNTSSTQFEFNPRTVTPVESIAFTSSNTDIGTLLWKISWMNFLPETQRQSRPNWKTFINELCVRQQYI